MKKLKGILLMIFLISCSFSHAQLVASIPILESFAALDYVEKGIYYAQSIAQFVESATNSYNQFQLMVDAQKKAIQNLRGIADIKSWDDFMSWYNRQLYLERQAENKFNNVGVKIGNKSYNIQNIADIPNAIKHNFGTDYWDSEFTEAQRKQMWTNLGLTPANYAYLKTWEARLDPKKKEFLFRSEIQNESYMKDMEMNKIIIDKLALDKSMPDDDKVREKELLSMIVETTLRNNKATNDIAMMMAENQELQAILMYKDEMVDDIPPISSAWYAEPFRQLERNGTKKRK